MSEEDMRRIFSRNLNFYLSQSGRTQADLYKYMNVSSAAVSCWCNGQKMPRMDKIQSICNWLGIEKSDLLEEKTSEEKEASSKMAKALELYELYEKSIPEIQKAVENLLRASQSDK